MWPVDLCASLRPQAELELQQLSAKYRALPLGRRGPDEITVVGPELAAAAAAAGEAAAATVLAEAEAASNAASTAAEAVTEQQTETAKFEVMSPTASAVDPTQTHGVPPPSAFPVLDGEDVGSCSGGEAVGSAATRVAAERAAAMAAGKVLIPEVPGFAAVLHVDLGVSKDKVKQLALKWPRLLEVSADNVGESVRWFLGELRVGRGDAARLVLTHPPILIKSVERQLKPNLHWLEDELGLNRDQVRKVVCACPQLLTKSLSANFVPKLEFFEREIGLARGHVSVMLLRYPQLFNLSLTNMTRKARCLSEETLLTERDLRNVLGRCPSLFAYSARKKLVPTLQFFEHELGATKIQIRLAILKHPRLLGMSLEKRLLPRLKDMHAAGVAPSWQAHHAVILFARDDIFRQWLEDEAQGGDF